MKEKDLAISEKLKNTIDQAVGAFKELQEELEKAYEDLAEKGKEVDSKSAKELRKLAKKAETLVSQYTSFINSYLKKIKGTTEKFTKILEDFDPNKSKKKLDAIAQKIDELTALVKELKQQKAQQQTKSSNKQ